MRWHWFHYYPGYFYEKQANSNVWNAYYKGEVSYSLREFFFSIDQNGFPVVILKQEDITAQYQILTAEDDFGDVNQTHIHYVNKNGFWARNKGKIY